MTHKNLDKSYMNPNRLLLTQRGTKWLDQFDLEDRESARRLIGGLTLVSSRFFDIAIKDLVQAQVDESSQPIALYAVREVDNSSSIFEQENSTLGEDNSSSKRFIDAIGRGSGIGSEGRVAALIKQISRANGKHFMDHPNLNYMRERKCRVILLVDDLIGSGNRINEFLHSIWLSPTIRSWVSLKLVEIRIIAFAATELGKKRIMERGRVKSISANRDCPTFRTLPWSKFYRDSCISLCEKYGCVAFSPQFSLGYRNTMASLVFDHGCPNNVPSILWARGARNRSWNPMFPNRSVGEKEHSVFPPEITNREPVSVLLDAGHKRLAKSSLVGKAEPGRTVILLLALIAKGQRKNEALTFGTGLSNRELEEELRRCMESGWISTSRRITRDGVAELRTARRRVESLTGPPSIGDDDYYPKALRVITRG